MSKKEYENVQWIYDFVVNSHLTISDEGKKELTYYHYLTPFSEPFYGQLNPVMLFCGHRGADFSSKKVWTLRDGIIPLTVFFKENVAKDFDAELIVPLQFWFVVPTEWRSKTRYYEVVSDAQYSKEKLPKRILLTGFMNSTLADPQELVEELDLLSTTLGKENLKDIEIVAYFSAKRNDLWGGWREENILKFSKTIFEKLKMDIRFPEYNAIISENDYTDCLYYEVNKNYLIQESFLKHFVMSRGAGSLKRELPQYPVKNPKEYRVSPYHSYFIYELDPNTASEYMDPLNEKNYEMIAKVLASASKEQKFSNWWETWFATYVKKFYKGQKSKKNI